MKITIKKSSIWIIVLISLSVICSTANAQSGTMLPKFNIFDDPNLVLESEKLNDYDFKFTILDRTQTEKEEVFVVMPLKEQAFINGFARAVKSIAASGNALSENTKSKLIKDSLITSQAQMAFIFVQSAGITSSQLSTQPKAGTLCLNREIEVRQYLRVNGLDLRQNERKFLLIRLKKDENILLGKMINQTTASVRHDSNKKVKAHLVGNQDVPEDSIPENAKGYVASRKSFLLMASKNSNLPTFESYQTKAEALNRLDFLAAKQLSNSRAHDIAIAISSIKEKEDSLKLGRAKMDSIVLNINLLESEKVQKQLAKAQLDAIEQKKNESKAQFNEVGKQIDYRIEDLDRIIIHNTSRWSKRKDSLEIDDAIGGAGNIAIRSDQKKEDLVIFSEVLKKIIDFRKKNSAKLILLDSDWEVLKYFTYETFYKEDGAKTPASLKAYWNSRGYPEILSEQRNVLAEINEATQDLMAARESIERLKQYRIDLDNYSKSEIAFSKMTGGSVLEAELSESKESLATIRKTEQRLLGNLRVLNADKMALKAGTPLDSMDVNYASFEFNQGFIENVVVFGKIKDSDREVKFTNVQPIGFSRAKDYEDLRNFELWTEYSSNNNGTQYSMNLGDLVSNYQQNLALNRRDYSPMDGAKKFDLENGTCYELKKAPSYQLLEARVFSDFVGLDATSPNGLLQTEFGHRINLKTDRIGRYCRSRGGIRDRSKRMLYFTRNYRNTGLFSYIYPSVTISKIENSNRSLLLDSRDRVVNNEYFQERYASTIALRNYEVLNVGVDLNIRTWDLPFLKSTFTLDLGVRFGRTVVIDSIRALVAGSPQNTGKGSEFGVNTFRWYPKFTWEIKPEERYGLSMSYYWNQYYLWSPNVKQVSVPARFEAFGENRRPFGYGTAEFQAYFNPSVDSPTGKLFFRYTFNHQGTEWNTNFHQAQVGYSFFFLGRNKVREQN